MLRQIGWGVQNGLTTVNGVLPNYYIFLKNLISVEEPLYKDLF